MQNAQVNGTSTAAAAPLTVAAGADLLGRIEAVSVQRETLVCELITAIAEANRGGVCESVEGLPIDLHLADQLRWSRAEVRMILDAGDALAAMPATLLLWQRRVLSWSIVREIVAAVRPLGREARGMVDARLDATAGRLADMTAEQISWAVDEAVAEARGHLQKQKDEERAERSAFMAFQLGFDGGSRMYGELDAIGTAIVTGALDARADSLPEQPPASQRERRRSRAQRRADALVGMATDDLGTGCTHGHDDPAPASGADDVRSDAAACPGRPGPSCHPYRPAKPLIMIHVPLDRLTMTAAGLLEVAVPNAVPTLSAALVENLASDADIRAVIFDGKRPLHVTAKTDAASIPADTRLAVAARDLGARDPGGATPIPLSHQHHLRPGTHDPDLLVTASPRGHLRVIHQHGWSGRIDPATAAVTSPRGDRTIRTLPWGTRLQTAGTATRKRHPADQPPLPEPPH